MNSTDILEFPPKDKDQSFKARIVMFQENDENIYKTLIDSDEVLTFQLSNFLEKLELPVYKLVFKVLKTIFLKRLIDNVLMSKIN